MVSFKEKGSEKSFEANFPLKEAVKKKIEFRTGISEFSLKGEIVHIFGFVEHLVSIAPTLLL